LSVRRTVNSPLLPWLSHWFSKGFLNEAYGELTLIVRSKQKPVRPK
jgi:hypothetical protein